MNDETRTVDPYDRMLGSLDGLQGTLSAGPSTLQVTSMVSSGTYIVRTIRRQDRTVEVKDGRDVEVPGPAEFYQFVEYHDKERHVRLVLPPAVTAVAYRQRDTLAERARRQAARRATATRKERGIVPAFQKRSKK